MKVIYIGKNQFPITRYGEHSHKHWEITFQLSGHVTTTTDNKSFLFSKGDILVTPPGFTHSGSSDVPFTNMYLAIDQLDFPAEPFVVRDTDMGVYRLLQILYKVFCKKEGNYTLLANSLAEAIYQYIKKYAGERTKYPFVAQLQEVIYNNLDNPDFDLKDEIKKMGFCQDYLRRCFKEDTGKTPLGYLTWMRLSLAQNLLAEDNFLSIENVTHRCGFKDPFYFSTCFKKHIGCTPSQYRKDNIGN